MANAVYATFFEHVLRGEIDLTTATVKVACVGTGYTFNQFHEFLSDITDVVQTGTLANIVFPGGIIDADDTLINAPSAEIAALILYVDTGSPTTSPLFLFLDTGLNIPSTPSGQSLIIWPNDATIKIFPLGGRP